MNHTDRTIGEIKRVTAIGMLLNLVLAAVKLIVGFFSSSQALIADGVHSFSDLATDLAVIIGVRFWSAPPDPSHPYGHAKIETLVTAVIGIALGAVGFAIGWEALATLHSRSTHQMGLPALLIAILSIVSKEVLYQWTRNHADKLHSSALAANAWHHRSDALSSIPVAAAIAVAYWFPTWDFIDKVGAAIVSVFILYSAWKILKPTLFELSDAAPVDSEAIRRICFSVPGTMSVHAIRARKTGSSAQVDLHLLVVPDMSVLEGHGISTEIRKKLLASELGISEAVIHIEPYNEAEKKEGRQSEIQVKETET